MIKKSIKEITTFFEKTLFVEDKTKENEESLVLRDDTEHYREEIGTLFLDQIFVISTYESTKKLLERYKYHSEREVAKDLVSLLIQ